MFNKSFDPDKSFFDLNIVRITIGVVITIVVFCFVLISMNSNLVFDFSYKGFNSFLVFFKVPIGVLASLIPIVALYAANHRSVQTKRQIELSRDQNNFVNFYKHLEEFEKYISQLELGEYEITHPIKLHELLFNPMRKGNPVVDCDAVGLFDFYLNKIVEGLKVFQLRMPPVGQKLFIEEVISIREMLMYDFGIKYKNESLPNSFDLCGCEIRSLNRRGNGIFLDIRDMVVIYCKIASFDSIFIPSEKVEEYLNIDMDSIPDAVFLAKEGSCYFPPFKLKYINP